ncbi:hypothetical protein ACGFZQ_12430 [Streptomyces sp. NPDC048254]
MGRRLRQGARCRSRTDAPGQPMLTLVEEQELTERAHLRAPRPTG